MPDYESGVAGSNPAGDAKLIFSQVGVAVARRSYKAEVGFDPLLGYGGHGVAVCTLGCDPVGTGSIPVDRLKGELGNQVAQRPVKPCSSEAQVQILPRPRRSTLPVRELPPPLRKAAAWLKSGRKHHVAYLTGGGRQSAKLP